MKTAATLLLLITGLSLCMRTYACNFETLEENQQAVHTKKLP